LQGPLASAVNGLSGYPPLRPTAALGGLLGLWDVAASTARAVQGGGAGAIFILFLLVLFRVIFRKPWAAVAAVLIVAGVLYVLGTPGGFSPGILTGLLLVVAILAVLVRFGFLAVLAGNIVSNLLTTFPIPASLSVWYAGCGLYTLALVAAIAAYGFHCSLGGRPAFGQGLLHD